MDGIDRDNGRERGQSDPERARRNGQDDDDGASPVPANQQPARDIAGLRAALAAGRFVVDPALIADQIQKLGFPKVR